MAKTEPEQHSDSSKSRKPNDSAFKQQRLPAWQPILTAGTVLPTFFVIGIAFIPIGIGMLWFSDQVMESKIDYTNCANGDGVDCSTLINNVTDVMKGCVCKPLTFELNEDWKGEVFMYYGLTNFYQNHRRYVKSRDDSQLLGSLSTEPSDDCAPFDVDNVTGLPYYPCGAIANSLFNDEITLSYFSNGKEINVGLIRTGISWDSDKRYKFHNPPIPLGKSLKDVLEGKFSKPRDWNKNLWELDPTNEDNNGLQNEDLIVWMRTAALPNFRKLYRKINHTGIFQDGLPKGNYVLNINYRYRVVQFSGTKSIILSTTSLLGGKNPFLGIAYIVVGCICLVVGVLFLFIHIKCGKTTNEMMNITSRTPYT